MLSLPTKEYFQSSGWVEELSTSSRPDLGSSHEGLNSSIELSVRSGSDFYADAQGHTPSSSAFYSAGFMSDWGNESGVSYSTSSSAQKKHARLRSHEHRSIDDDGDDDSQVTETPGDDNDDDGIIDDVEAHDAFVAGMIYALSRRIVPGLPYTPSWAGEDPNATNSDFDTGRWRLDECLR